MTSILNSQKLSIVKSINFRNSLNESLEQDPDKLAGFIYDGKFSWIAYDAILRVVSTDTGVEVAYYNFAKYHGVNGCIINCVEEIKCLAGVCLLAVCIEFTNSTVGAGMLSIFCVQGSKILGAMDICERITCCKFLHYEACRRSVLRLFNGCLAVGTEQGKLFLIDLMISKDSREVVLSPSYDSELFPMINLLADIDQIQITHHHRKITSNREKGEKCFFALQLKPVLEDSGSILSILCMPNLYMMSVGLDDGRMVLYDLIELQAFHLAYPPGNRAPLTHMSFIEPTDDPRSAVYIWSFHSTKDGAVAVMHSIMFDNKIDGFYDDFRSCSVRLTMPMFSKDTFPVCCRAIRKSLTQDEEDVLTVNLLAWTSPARKRTHVMIFDLNQWYKEEMPSVGDWRNQLKYAVVFDIPSVSLDIICDQNSLLPFNSIMRPEEHFYPNSLSFDIIVLETDKFTCYRWNGLQNITLQQFNIIGPQMILEPNFYFNEFLQVSLIPQFYETNFNIGTPINIKREFLLSLALEYNFTGFLKKCAWAWADGSYLGKDGSVGVGLSTLIDWIWNRVRAIKDICNRLCEPLFDYSEQRIDCGTQKQLSLCCKQLKILSELLQIITRDYQKCIPENLYSQIKTQSETVKMAADYQEILQWLLNVGLLPEGHHNSIRDLESDEDFVIVPYPYRIINSHYTSQRLKLSNAENNSKYLFIDAFIENECNGDELLKAWEGLYPPKSIQALLRSLLIPEISTEKKYVIFVYLFMDITNILSESSYSNIVRNLIKFPTVFKMNPAIIKRTQAFWNLDNDRLETAVEELISPLSHDRYLPQWQRELLIGALLKLNAYSLALRALRCPGNPISPDLEVATLLANNLVSEALKIQRTSGDRALLEKLFDKILHSSNYEQLLDLALTEIEGRVLRDYLQKTDLSNCVNLHFVYLLQRSKFIDAAQLMESFSNETNLNLEPPKQVLNAYYSTMEPTTKKLTSLVYAEDVQVKESPLPLSVNLIKARCNASNDIYRKCVQSITEATYEVSQEVKELPFIGTPKLGIFEYKQPTVQMQEITYPVEFNEHGKRRQNDNNNGIFKLQELEGPQRKRRKLNELLQTKVLKSFADKRIAMLTKFKHISKPEFNFAKRSPKNSSSRAVTPDRTPLFSDLLNTPVIHKKTPQKVTYERSGTPHSILKTRSCRGSVSPAHSRMSEFDDKSVKSITFAALPGTRESSLHDSSYLDESFGGAEQMESSAEFYSPGKSPRNVEEDKIISPSTSIPDGPKVRPSIKSRSTTPLDHSQQSNKEGIETTSTMKVEQSASKNMFDVQTDVKSSTKIETTQKNVLNDTVTSIDSEELKPFRERDILKSFDETDTSESDEESVPNESIYGFVRKSVLPDSFSEIRASSEDSIEEGPIERNILESTSNSSDSDDDDDIAEDEHFEEEQLPEHSDYDDDDEDESDDGYQYGEIDLNDSDSSESNEMIQKQLNIPSKTEVIEITDSDDDNDEEVQIQEPIIHSMSQVDQLPSFRELETQPNVEYSTPVNEEECELTVLEPAGNVIECEVVDTEEQMINILYEDIQEQASDSENIEEEIKSPSFEIISPQKSTSEYQDLETDPVPQQNTSNEQEIQNPMEINTIKNETREEKTEQYHHDEESEKEIIDSAIVDKNIATDQAHFSEKLTSSEEQNVQKTENAQHILDSTEKPNVSEISEDYSFVSATGSELNEAALFSSEINENQSTIQSIVDEKQLVEFEATVKTKTIEIIEYTSDKTDSTNIFDKAMIENEISQFTTTEESANQSENALVGKEEEDETNKMEESQETVETKETEAIDDNSKMDVEPESNQLDGIEDEISQKESIIEDESINQFEIARIEDEEANNMEESQQTNEIATIDTDERMDENQTEIQNEDEVSENPLEIAQIIDDSRRELGNNEAEVVQNEDDKEIEEIMRSSVHNEIKENNDRRTPEQCQEIPVDLSTPKRRSSRIMSEEIEIEGERQKRATSVPSNASGTSSPRSRSSRASSEYRYNPKVLLKERMLERIEESPSGPITRNKSKLMLEASRETTPHTPTHSSRAASEDTDSVKKTPRRRSTATPTTPRRITRAASKESDISVNLFSVQNDEKTPEEGPTSSRRNRRKITATSDDDETDDTKSQISTRSTSSRKKATPSSSSKVTPEKTSPTDELSVRNRRLTRSQLAMLEKSQKLAAKISSESLLKKTDYDLKMSSEAIESDSESVKSENSTRTSSSRPTRKRKVPKRFEDSEDTKSIASKSSRKSKSPKKPLHLSAIPEESHIEVTLSEDQHSQSSEAVEKSALEGKKTRK